MPIGGVNPLAGLMPAGIGSDANTTTFSRVVRGSVVLYGVGGPVSRERQATGRRVIAEPVRIPN